MRQAFMAAVGRAAQWGTRVASQSDRLTKECPSFLPGRSRTPGGHGNLTCTRAPPTPAGRLDKHQRGQAEEVEGQGQGL